MAKITKRQLSRGVKLTTDLAQEPIRAVEAQIEAKNVEEENLVADRSIFRVNFNIPQINSCSAYAQKLRMQQYPAGAQINESHNIISCVAIPFTLPPPQEHIQFNRTNANPLLWSGTDKTDENTPFYVLDELSFSFDQRAEGMGIQDYFSSLPTYGWDVSGDPDAATDRKLVLDGADNYKIRISIIEKTQTWFNYPHGEHPSSWWHVREEELAIQNEIVSVEVPAIAFKSKNLRLNPFAIDQLNKQLKPWKTYVVIIQAPDLCGKGKETFIPATGPEIYTIPELFGLMSFNLSLKMRCKLMEKDTSVASGIASAVQNIPTDHYGVTTAPVLPITYANPGDPISAEDTAGIQTNINIIDDAIKNKLDGGYTKESDLQGPRALKDTAGYEMIAVPMWGNFGDFGVMDRQLLHAMNTFPAITSPLVAAQNNIGFSDRRIIPINYPMTIHHVIIGTSYINPVTTYRNFRGTMQTAGTHPKSETLRNHVGVAIGTGKRNVDTTYQQVAELQWGTNDDEADNPRRNYTIDRVSLTDTGTMIYTIPPPLNVDEEYWELELLECPLVSFATREGVGYANQGTPFFVGKGVGGMTGVGAANNTHGTINRSFTGDAGAGGYPHTLGREQWLEVRWNIWDPSGLSSDVALEQHETIVGLGGMWVYIIGKKHLTHWKDDLNLP